MELMKKLEILADSQEFSNRGPLLTRVMEKYPQLCKKLLLDLVRGEQSERMVRMLETLSLPFEFSWNECRCYVNGNILFYAVWTGAYDLVKELLRRGMDPDGTSRDIYITKKGEYLTPHSRWGKMKCRQNRNTFSSYTVWGDDPWGIMDEGNTAYLITPLFLAELTEDREMAVLLREHGACPMPSREKMWEDAKAPENGGSVFGNL